MGENFGLFKSFGDRLFEGELPINLGLIGSTILIDSDVSEFFGRVTSAGGTLSATEQSAIITLVADLKSFNLWNSMKAIYPMVGSSAAACAQNLKSSSFTGTFSSGWTFASNGATPNGTSAFMNTNFIPSANLGVNSTHGSLYLNTNNLPINSDPGDFGTFITGGQAFLLTQSSGVGLNFSTRNLGSGFGTTQLTRFGFGITSKTSATVTTLYKNGVNVISSNSEGILPTNPSLLGAFNYTGGSPYGTSYTNNRIAFHSLGDGLTDTQAANFYTAVQAFQITLARQV